MRHLPALAAAACLPLLACGGPEQEESPEPKPDSREQLVGTYEARGTLTVIVNGVPSSTPMHETLVLQSSAARDVLSLRLASLDCSMEGKMSGARAFVLHARSCALPPTDACTSTLNFTGGSGSGRQAGLELSLQAQRITRCGDQPVVESVSLELSSPGHQ